jgi:hypothetical protein
MPTAHIKIGERLACAYSHVLDALRGANSQDRRGDPLISDICGKREEAKHKLTGGGISISLEAGQGARRLPVSTEPIWGVSRRFGFLAMTLLRYGKTSKEKPALIGRAGKSRNLGKAKPEADAGTLEARALARLMKRESQALPAVRGDPRIGPCAGRTHRRAPGSAGSPLVSRETRDTILAGHRGPSAAGPACRRSLRRVRAQ